MLMKKLKNVMLTTAVTLTLFSVSVYASEKDVFTDGGVVGQTEELPSSELTENVFDDGTEVMFETPEVLSESAVFTETELSSDQFVYEGVIYRKDTGRDTCGIVGYTEEVPENLTLKEYVSDGTKDLFVYSIADKAFQNCTKLKKVTVESAFFEVGKNIFDGCEGLTVECYRYTYLYNDLKDNEKINLIIRERPVNGKGEDKVEIDGVRYSGNERTWYSAAGLRGDISIKSGLYGTPVTEFPWMYNEVERVKFPDTIREIGDGYYETCMFAESNIREIIIPDHITMIYGEFIASECKMLEYVHTGNGYRRIKTSEYSDCINLKKVDIGTSVEVINDGAFKNCYSLKELYIPSNVKEISATAFWGIEDSITIIGENGSYAEAYASSMGIKFRSNGKTAETPVLKLNKPVVSGNVIDVSIEGEHPDIVKYEYVLSQIIEYEPEEPDMSYPNELILAEVFTEQKVDNKKNQVKFQYVSEAVDYYIRVRGLKKDKTWTIWSPPKKATVKINTPAQPKIGKVTVNGSTVTVTLENRDKYADAYDYVLGIKPEKTFLYRDRSDKEVTQTVPSVEKYTLKDKNTTKVTFKNVKKGTYYLSVRGYAKDGKKKFFSLPSEIQKVQVYRPAAVTGVKLSGRTKDSLTCSWNHAKISPDGYIVYVKDSDTGKTIKRVSVKKTIGSVTIKGLEAGQRYKVIVRAYNKVNGKNYYSAYNESQIIAFTIPKTPSLKVQAVSGYKAKLTWKPTPAAYRNGKCEYIIYYRNAKDKSYQQLTRLPDTKGSYTTKALKKNNSYYFRMRSIVRDENGEHTTKGAYSKTIKITIK